MSKPAVVLVEVEHYHELIEFLVHFPDERRGQAFWKDRLLYWWDRNPAFPECPVRGWVLKDEDRIVGFMGNIPTLMLIQGESRPVFNMTTWRVLPSYRVHSLALLMRCLKAAEHTFIFNTTPNEPVRKVVKMLDFKLLPMYDPRRTTLFLTHAARKPGRLSRALDLLPFSPGAILAGKVRAGTVDNKYSTEELSGVSPTVTALFQDAASRFDITNVRNADALNWYCFGNKDLPKALIACRSDVGEVLGYVILEIRSIKGMNRLDCLDIWMKRPDVSATRALVAACLTYGRDHRCDLFCVDHVTPELVESVSRLPFTTTEAIGDTYFYKIGKHAKTDLMPEPNYFVRAQGDIGL